MRGSEVEVGSGVGGRWEVGRWEAKEEKEEEDAECGVVVGGRRGKDAMVVQNVGFLLFVRDHFLTNTDIILK